MDIIWEIASFAILMKSPLFVNEKNKSVNYTVLK